MDHTSDVNCSLSGSTGESASASRQVLSSFSNVITKTPISKNWCITGVEEVSFSFSFIWTIKGFSLCRQQPGEELSSLTFLTGRESDEIKWRIEVYPMGDTEENKNHLSLYLVLDSCNQTEVKVGFRFFIINAKGERYRSVNDADVDDLGTFANGESWGKGQFVERVFLLDPANDLLPNDNLTILCEGSVEGVRADISGHSTASRTEVAKCTLSQDFGSLFESQKFGDITISVGDKELLVYKAILAARSPVFAAMFAHKIQNQITVKDVDYEVLREMLIYIYSGKSPNIESQSDRLLAAADKYDLVGLKSMCEEVLCAKISVENAVDLLVLADSSCAGWLKARANHFINTRVKYIIHTPAWKNMILKHPHLFAEAFAALAIK